MYEEDDLIPLSGLQPTAEAKGKAPTKANRGVETGDHPTSNPHIQAFPKPR